MEKWSPPLHENLNVEFMAAAGSTYEETAFNQTAVNDKLSKQNSEQLNCPQCNLCWTVLQDTSYEKNGVAICKSCYDSAGSNEKCYKCKAVILNSELVMKCEGAFFHWGCFSCSICDDKLEKGKKYGIIEGELFCEQHFIDASFELKKELERRELQQTENDFLAYFCYSLEQSLFQSNLLQPINNPDFQIELLIDPPSGYLSLEKPQYENNEPLAVNTSLIQSNGISLGQIKSKSAVRNKRKRHRTKFRQDQLQGMKSVFDTNPNPDAAELQRLSERLVLTKRVLQVWFQNARAKEKRRPSSRKTQCI